MTLSHGRGYLAIPGPSVMPEPVLQTMHRPAPNIYEGELHEITKSLVPDLCRVARTEGHVAMYIANGHGAWEAALANTHSRADKILVLATGRFGHGWSEVATKMGIEVEILDFGRQSPIDVEQVETALAADTGHSIRSVLAVHVDTASSAKSDIAALRAAMDRAGHPALLQVDCIASLGCDPFEMDAWGVDVMVTGSQKGLMTPPGMAFVFFNDRADAARERADLASHYWDWRPRTRPEGYYQYFDGTAPTHHLYGLRAAMDLLHGEGIEAVWARHERLAKAVWAALEAWGQGGPLRLNIADPAVRSHAVTSVQLPGRGTDLRRWTESQAGVTLGIGLGMETPQDPNSDGAFRIGHMGHLNSHMILGVLGAIESGLRALDIPFGPGALEAAAKACA